MFPSKNRFMYSLLLTVIVTTLAGCGGKDAIAPVDVQAQAFEDLRTEIRAAIDDPVRAEEAIRLVDALVTDFEDLGLKFAERNRYARQLHSNYDTTRDEFVEFIDQMYSELQARQQAVTKRQHALIAITSAEEWNQISDARSEAISAAIASIQAN